MSNVGSDFEQLISNHTIDLDEIIRGLNDDDKSSKEEEIFKGKTDYRKRTSKSLKNNRYRLNTNLRFILAGWTVLVVTVWLWKVLEILVNNNERYCLSDSVLFTLLATTTVNVLGIIFIVLKDLFNGKSEYQ